MQMTTALPTPADSASKETACSQVGIITQRQEHSSEPPADSSVPPVAHSECSGGMVPEVPQAPGNEAPTDALSSKLMGPVRLMSQKVRKRRNFTIVSHYDLCLSAAQRRARCLHPKLQSTQANRWGCSRAHVFQTVGFIERSAQLESREILQSAGHLY